MKNATVCCLAILLVSGIAINAQQITPPTSLPCPGLRLTSVINWTQFHFDLCHTGNNPYEFVLSPTTVVNLRLDWQYTTGSFIVSSSPTVANGVMYIGSWDNNVYALNARTGALLWKYATGGPVDSAPAVANGVVYFGSWDFNVYALNARTGALLWKYTTGAPVDCSPTVASGGCTSGPMTLTCTP